MAAAITNNIQEADTACPAVSASCFSTLPVHPKSGVPASDFCMEKGT